MNRLLWIACIICLSLLSVSSFASVEKPIAPGWVGVGGYGILDGLEKKNYFIVYNTTDAKEYVIGKTDNAVAKLYYATVLAAIANGKSITIGYYYQTSGVDIWNDYSKIDFVRMQ